MTKQEITARLDVIKRQVADAVQKVKLIKELLGGLNE